MAQDNSLVKRGLLLLAMMSLIVGVLLMVLLQAKTGEAPRRKDRPELLVSEIVVVSAAFPASISWPNLFSASAALPSSTGWEIRYNAARTLALRGSAKVPWPIFGEMLDEERQMCNYRVTLQDGAVVSDESAARQNILIGLRAIRDWHKKQAGPSEVSTGLAAVYASVDRLAESSIAEIKAQADRTRQTFFR